MKKLLLHSTRLITLLFTLLPGLANGQAGAGMKANPAATDSLPRNNYPHTFPIFGERAAAKGFVLPYPAGIMLNTFAASQQVVISDLKVGFNDSPLQDFDFVQFGEVKANLQNVNVRADLWVFPFMNVYGLFGPLFSQTSVSVTAPVAFTTKTNFRGYTYGVGTTLAAGFHGFWATVDLNSTWTDLEQFDKPVNASMISPRAGIAIPFAKRPASNMALWVGCTYLILNRETSGKVKVRDIIPEGSGEVLQNIIDQTETWYQTLTPPQKIVVDQLARALQDRLNGLDAGDASIAYSLKKAPAGRLSMMIGAQYQHSMRWQFRTEVGFLGGRTSGLLSANYRFHW